MKRNFGNLDRSWSSVAGPLQKKNGDAFPAFKNMKSIQDSPWYLGKL